MSIEIGFDRVLFCVVGPADGRVLEPVTCHYLDKVPSWTVLEQDNVYGYRQCARARDDKANIVLWIALYRTEELHHGNKQVALGRAWSPIVPFAR